MTLNSTNRIAKLRFSEPARNLPGHGLNGREERRFTYKFAQAYLHQFRTVHFRSNKDRLLLAREIPANGYGIADIVAISWKSGANSGPLFGMPKGSVIRAFEVKIRDWRKGLLQANRYRFFSHLSILVIPAKHARKATEHLSTFKLLGLGLWTFDSDSNTITALHTPRTRRPLDKSQSTKAVAKVLRANRIKSRPVF